MALFFAIHLAIIVALLQFAISHNNTLVVIRWNKRLTSFEPISGNNFYDTEKNRLPLRTRNEESYNFNTEPLRVSFYEDPAFIHFYDNDSRIAGLCGDIWTTLSELLNFTIVLRRWEHGSLGEKFENGTFSGILEDARLNKTDVIPKLQVYKSRTAAVVYTPAFWTNGQMIFAFDQWKRDHIWMFKLFTGEVWCTVVAFIVILSLLSNVTHRVLIGHKSARPPVRSFFYHFFNTFAMLCNQGDMMDSTRTASRILTLTNVTFSWLILISYSSCLIYSVTRETFVAPFSDLETLFEQTNIQIVVLNGSLSHVTFTSSDSQLIFHHLMKAKRVTIVSNLTELYSKVCLSSGQYVLFSGVDAMLGIRETLCNLLPVGSTYYMRSAASGISKRVKNKRSLDIGIIKLREFGLIEAMKKRYIPYTEIDSPVRQADNLAIDIDHISFILMLFFAGIIASIVLCLAENIFHSFKKRRAVKL